ncbi:hypothetical protein RND71_008835 [Anisodus tanguticus]|uniref:GRAM domain-containing protein n=1 Tax=Anisodus tanguticus TaxID=243964 RepID=A0AAE1VR26_9SOLA|nr:hypothetical protein RND71_008835 [Anisodus tanguticus]
MSSAVCPLERQPKRLQSLSACQDHVPPATLKHLSKIKQRKSVISKKNKLGERMDCLAQGIREHVSLSPKLTETMKGKLSLGAKILQVGGLERIFKQKFSVRDEEKLIKVSQCYLSTTAGPMAGLLFISTNKIAFCSERPLKLLSPTGKFLRIHYKVSIPISKIQKAKESENREKPSQKYIQVITEDDFEFWFMEFLNHQKTEIYLQQAISSDLCSNHNTEDLRAQEESHDRSPWVRVCDYEADLNTSATPCLSQQPGSRSDFALAYCLPDLALL